MSFVILFSCSKKQHSYTNEQVEKFKHDFEKYVAEKNEYCKSNESPLKMENIKGFNGLHYFEYNPNFRFEGPINIYEDPDSVIIYGSKQDERPSIKYGYFEFTFDENEYKLQIFKILRDDPEQDGYLFLGFTDETSNRETYGGGRYINLEQNQHNFYVIDFNYAYNPYCAYNPKYSCAIPSKENHLKIAIKAGEKKYHD